MRALLRGDAVEQQARGVAFARAPTGAARGDEVRLRTQDHAVVEHLEAIGGERRAGRGDVDDHFGAAGRRCAFGRARAFDDAIVDDAVPGEERARQVGVFGGEPHLALVLEAECGRDIVEVGHVAHVDPGLRHRDHDIGEAEAERIDQHDARIDIGDHLAHQILAGDAEMDRALRQLRRDFRCGQISDLDAVDAGNGAAIIARAARLDEFEPRAREEGFGVLLQPAFRRHGEDERRAHGAPPHAASRSIQAAKPTAGIGSAAPSRVSKPS